MAIIEILQYPDKRLKRQGITVTEFGKATQKIIDDMFETHYSAENCAALAATQLNIPKAPHISVIDFSAQKNEPLCIVNGEIIHKEGEQFEEEGCMSVQGLDCVFTQVKRALKIKIKAQDRHGEVFEMEAEGFMAKCIQHELDHLNGKIYLDRVSQLKRQRIEKQIIKKNRLDKADNNK